MRSGILVTVCGSFITATVSESLNHHLKINGLPVQKNKRGSDNLGESVHFHQDVFDSCCK